MLALNFDTGHVHRCLRRALQIAALWPDSRDSRDLHDAHTVDQHQRIARCMVSDLQGPRSSRASDTTSLSPIDNEFGTETENTLKTHIESHFQLVVPRRLQNAAFDVTLSKHIICEVLSLHLNRCPRFKL